ncbi:hypothetical protein WAJ43_22200, partial [Acinetobacter baumannii]
ALLRISELMESGKIGICKVHPNALAMLFEPIYIMTGYSIHLSNLGANMSMSRCGSPSLWASARHDFMAVFTSVIMLSALSDESIYSPA